MYRKILNYLEEWKKSEYRKPLILQGARQVGKTYAILEFGRRYYENVAYFNFETDPKLNATFEENISPEYLIPILSHIAGKTIVREKTLIVFDEVQLCERALTSLKYFCEAAPEYPHYRGRKFSWRSGEQNEIFLPGREGGYENALSDGHGRVYDGAGAGGAGGKNPRVLPDGYAASVRFCHDRAMQIYRQYLVVGGMPECVMQFSQTGDYVLVRHTQDTILAGYLNDMSKYNNLNEIKKTRLVYDNITVQLSRKNTRFQYKLVKKGGRAAEF